MYIRLFCNRMQILLMRSNLIVKIALTFLVLALIFASYYWGVQSNLNDAQHKLLTELHDLNIKKKAFDDALADYQLINARINSHPIANLKVNSAQAATNHTHLIAQQARLSNLNLQSYSVNQPKPNFKQMHFNFVSGYQALLVFLRRLDQVNLAVSCQKLKITPISHRLQIAYVCGIHTFVK